MTIKALNVYRTYYPDPPGGLQEAIRQICLATSTLGVDNTVFTLSPNAKPPKIILPEGSVYRSRSWAAPASCDIGGLAAFLAFSRLAKQADFIQYHFPWPFADLLHWFVKPKIPAITIYHSDIVRQKLLGDIYSPLMWKTLQSMQVIIATSPAYAKTSPVLSHRLIQNKVRVIPLGIDETTYAFQKDASIFPRINVVDTEPYFLFLGVLRYYKGLHTLLSAAKSVNVKIVIAGAGPELERLQLQAKALGLNNVIFTEYVTQAEKVALIQNCLAFVLPSHLRSEAFGMVLVEAAMMQKPMISCEIGSGTSYVNLHEVTGLVVPPESSAHLANAMQLMLKDAALVEKMGKAARQRYESLFSGPALGRAYQAVYQAL